MRLPERKPSLIEILVVAMLVMLPLLAVLQYRWLGQVSQAERERLQAGVRAEAAKFSRDFNREVARAYLSFQMDPALLADAGAGLGERYANWIAKSEFPGLLGDVYWVEVNGADLAPLERFNPSAGKLEVTDWPAPLEGVRQHLERDLKKTGPSENVLREGVPGPVLEEIPALVIPLPSMHHRAGRDALIPLSITGYTIIRLDLDYIKQEMVPRLAERYFSVSGGLDYNLSIVISDDPEKVIYQSDPAAAPANLASNDATANLLGFGLEEFNSVLREEETRGSGAPRDPRRKVGQLTVRIVKGTGSDPVAASAQVAEDAGGWKLLLNHREGSLDSVVQRLRRRNLTISFGILLLLGLSVLMMIVSTRRAERLARQQMEFVAGVSHELRTPLAVICSAGENLADGVIADRSQIERYGSLIQKEGRRLSELVEQALEFAGIQSGRKAYDLRPVAVADLIERAVADCHRLLTERGCRIEKEIEPHLPDLSGDPSALGRVIQNLIGNAIKYGGSDGWIGVKARRSPAGRPAEIEIRVEDRGQGIQSSDLPHIFEPFYRGSEAIAAQIPGSGLGLSLVRHIVKAHGGRVSVESVEHRDGVRGTAFAVYLPAASPSAQDAEAEVDSAQSIRATQRS